MNDKQKQRLGRIINDLPDDRKLMYPKHLFEVERIEILWQLVLKEYYKLLPFLTEEQFGQLGDVMIEWMAGEGFELAPFYNWWNFLDSFMMGLKFKNIVPYVTSKNITWSEQQVDSKSIRLYWPVGTLWSGEHKDWYDYGYVKELILDNEEERLRNIKLSDQKSSDTKLSRDAFPIVLLQSQDGAVKLLDGNRRVMRAWLYDRPTIKAWVGKVEREPMVYEHWVNTADLRRLLEQIAQNPGDKAVWGSVRSQLELILPSSSVARANYKARCVPKHPDVAKIATDLLD